MLEFCLLDLGLSVTSPLFLSCNSNFYIEQAVLMSCCLTYHFYSSFILVCVFCHATECIMSLPPSVADRRKCVPYFLIRLSVISFAEGLRPRSWMLRTNSGVRDKGESRKSLRSTARLFTFQRPNSLQDNQRHIKQAKLK